MHYPSRDPLKLKHQTFWALAYAKYHLKEDTARQIIEGCTKGRTNHISDCDMAETEACIQTMKREYGRRIRRPGDRSTGRPGIKSKIQNPKSKIDNPPRIIKMISADQIGIIKDLARQCGLNYPEDMPDMIAKVTGGKERLATGKQAQALIEALKSMARRGWQPTNTGRGDDQKSP